MSLLSFILKRIETSTIPIDLGSSIILNFNLSVTVSIIVSIVYLYSNIDKFVNQPSDDTDPATGLDDSRHIHHGIIVRER
ncbi:MAG: hypothetical protein ACR5KV_07440 [Wolbachia sp.]